jgi:hypothetical protein
MVGWRASSIATPLLSSAIKVKKRYNTFLFIQFTISGQQCKSGKKLKLADYSTMDQEYVTSADGALPIDDNVEICEIEESDDNSDTDLVPQEELPTVLERDANEALQILQRYADQTGNVEMQKLCDRIDDMLSEEWIKNFRQRKIDEDADEKDYAHRNLLYPHT